MRVSAIFSVCITLLLWSVNDASAREYLGPKSKSNKEDIKGKAANCSPAQTFNQFFVNNVRTAAETGGNTWYDRGNGLPFYEVPAGGGNHALFAGSLWMGGTDPAGNLKLAAVRFRQVGNDFWPGPLTADGAATITPQTCTQYDRFFNMSRLMVETHRYYYSLINQGIDPSTDPLFEDEPYQIPSQILNWPAQGNTSLGQSNFLAPFADLRDPNTGEVLTTPGLYEPELGDYPLYDLDSEIDCRTRLVTDPVPLFGDFTMYWIFNDKGNIHTESQGEPIGMEIQAQMFGFNTNDEINNMTFCNYVLINRGSLTLEETFFCQWVDSDLGNYLDDYIGCDVERGLGYSYNGDNNDEGSGSGPGYGVQPPAVGVDFFEGPYQDPDGINNLYGIGEGQALNGLGYRNENDAFPDSIIDNERFGMRRFLYHNNTGQGAPEATTDPTIAIHYYNMMRGIWKDGTPMTFGGQGYNPVDPSAIPTDFMFPGESDPLNWGTQGVDPNYPEPGGWTEENEGNEAGDRRFVQSAGPFTLDPGEFNNITVGVVYARAATGGPFASVNRLLLADDKAQALFENCFRLLSGPDAPELTFQELDRQIIFYLRNTNPLSNNIGEEYEEIDPTIPEFDENGEPYDRTYNFQGYQVFQLRDGDVSVADIADPAVARLVFQVDVEDFDENGDPIGQLVNFEFDESIGLSVPVEQVDGANEGIRHSFVVTDDQFAQGDSRLVNFKKYYYVAVAYGYNEFEPYLPDPNNPQGQDSPYLVGRASATGAISPVTVIPSKPVPREFGTVTSSSYGDGVQVTRIEGQGNGRNALNLTSETIDDIMDGSPWKADSLVYELGQGPINVKVVDPLNVRAADFVLRFYSEDTDSLGNYQGDLDTFRWFMIDKNNPSADTIFSENAIRIANEQIVPEFGISVDIGQYEYDLVSPPDADERFGPAVLSSEISFGSDGGEWLQGVPDQEGVTYLNWIRAGNVNTSDIDGQSPCFLGEPTDQNPNPLPLDAFWDDKKLTADDPNLVGNQEYERIVDGTLAPAYLVYQNDCGVGPLNSTADSQILRNTDNNDLTDLSSVLIVITPDKDRWSRVPVFEMQHEPAFSQLNAEKMDLRGALSVDKNGLNQSQEGVNLDEATYFGEQTFGQEYVDDLSETELQELLLAYDAEYPSLDLVTGTGLEGDPFQFFPERFAELSVGMGWFPGYAINLETGERLNMGFGENSYFAADNGRDMLWNPSSRLASQLQEQLFLGGEHYYYVFGNNALFQEDDDEMPLYDGGTYAYVKFFKDNFFGLGQQQIYAAMEWIGFPTLADGFEYRSVEEGLVPGEVRIRANVAKPYERYATAVSELPDSVVRPFVPVDADSLLALSENQWYPMYEFSTEGLEVRVNQQAVAEEALDLIDVVPNPYYAYSSYEQSRVDNLVKFVNLPPECKIQIFTMNGTLIRVLEKDNPNTFLEWDLRNEAFIPIAGGMYLVHVGVPGVGERVLKFFCATRPADLRNL